MKNKKNNQKKSKKSLILKIAVVLLVLVVVYVGWVVYRLETGQLFVVDGEIYTLEEIQEKYPHHYSVEAKNTPKEIYSKFRQALLDDDIEKALECIEEEDRERYREELSDPDTLENYKTLPAASSLEIDENYNYENIKSYNYKQKDTIYSVEFIKKQNGYWKIEAI